MIRRDKWDVGKYLTIIKMHLKAFFYYPHNIIYSSNKYKIVNA